MTGKEGRHLLLLYTAVTVAMFMSRAIKLTIKSSALVSTLQVLSIHVHVQPDTSEID
jgi:hypothetical protein